MTQAPQASPAPPPASTLRGRSQRVTTSNRRSTSPAVFTSSWGRFQPPMYTRFRKLLILNELVSCSRAKKSAVASAQRSEIRAIRVIRGLRYPAPTTPSFIQEAEVRGISEDAVALPL